MDLPSYEALRHALNRFEGGENYFTAVSVSRLNSALNGTMPYE
jgi:hypothetical protein